MTSTIQKWGNSLAVRIPSAVARQMQIASGDAVDLKLEDGVLTLRAARPRYQLADLVNEIEPGNCHSEMDWGVSVGREV